MMLQPLGQNYIKSSLGQPIQRKPLGGSPIPLGTSQLPSITNLEENEGMGEFSYSPWGEGNLERGGLSSTPSIQARQDASFSVPPVYNEDIVSESNNIPKSNTSEVQRSLLDSPSLSTSQADAEGIVSENNNISESSTPQVQRSESDRSLSELPGYRDTYSTNNVTPRPKFSLGKFATNAIDNTLPIARKVIQQMSDFTSPKSSNLSASESIQSQEEPVKINSPEIQRSPVNSPSLSISQASDKNLVSDENNIREVKAPEVQRSLTETPSLSSPPIPDENIVSDENNIREVKVPEVQRSLTETPSLSSPPIPDENIVSDENNIREVKVPEVQRSLTETPSLSSPPIPDENIVSDENNIREVKAPEIQRSLTETPSLSSPPIPDENIVSDENNIREVKAPEVQRSLTETPSLSSPSTPDKNIVRDRRNISEVKTPEVQHFQEDKLLSELPGYRDVYSEDKVQSRPQFSLSEFAANTIGNTIPIARKVIQRVSEIASPKPSNFSPSESGQTQEISAKFDSTEIQESLDKPSLVSTLQTRDNNIVADNNISENSTSKVQRSLLELPSLFTPQTKDENLVMESNNIAEVETSAIQRSLSENPALSISQTINENSVSDNNNIAKVETSEIQRSLPKIPPTLTQTDTAIEESPVTTLSEGRGFLQLQPLGQLQPLVGDSDYSPSSFVATSLKEILSYSGESHSSIQKKENTERETTKTSISASETLDFPQSWSNIPELIGDSADRIDSGEAENWGEFSGLMGDPSLLPETPSTSNAIVQAKAVPIEGELILPISFEEIEEEEIPSLPASSQKTERELEKPIGEEELDFLAQLVYRLVRSHLNIEREQQYNQFGGASFWLDSVYFARDENSSLSSTGMRATLETVSPYTSDRLAILAREVYVLLQMRMECDRDRQGNYY
jgi:hypothetical protein